LECSRGREQGQEFRGEFKGMGRNGMRMQGMKRRKKRENNRMDDYGYKEGFGDTRRGEK